LSENIINAEDGFNLLFSHQPFPGYQIQLDWLRSEYSGEWYMWKEKRIDCWFCSVLKRFYPTVVRNLYAKAEPLDNFGGAVLKPNNSPVLVGATG